MNRRKFAKTVMGTAGVSMFVGGAVSAATISNQAKFEAGHQMRSVDGLKMTLSGHQLPTQNKDQQQFVLTFDVDNPGEQLKEKIYHLTDHNGKKHDIFMSPVDHNQLQAVFNWRVHA